MPRAKLGFFSLSQRSPTGDDRPYLRWHQLDHMPEQYQLPGVVLGQRWATTPETRAARTIAVDGWGSIDNVVCYLMGDPVTETLDDFYALGRQLAELGRFPAALPAVYAGGLRLLETTAAPSALISAEVVPFRPHTGVYLVVEEPAETGSAETGGWDAYLQQAHRQVLPAAMAVDGVAGAWVFATSGTLRHPRFSKGRYRMTILYLDGDPAATADRLARVLKEPWADPATRVLLAAPYESLPSTDWDRFAPND